jgi:secreted PhoX family phosphatase
MGRARWENSTIAVGADWKLVPGKKVVMYGTNDRPGGRIYKYVSERPYVDGMSRKEIRELLDEGSLFVAHFAGLNHADGTTLGASGKIPTQDAPGVGQWIRLSVDSKDVAPNAKALGRSGTTVGQALKDNDWNGMGGFPDDTHVRMALFTAASKVGVMETNRPEGIRWNPKAPSGTPTIYVAFTKHYYGTALNAEGTVRKASPVYKRTDRDGSIFAMVEKDPASPQDSVTFDYYVAWRGSHGDAVTDVACPDNVILDSDGGVWFGTDGNAGRNKKAEALYYLDLDPAHKQGQDGVAKASHGLAFRVASGPPGSEVTGPVFSSDETTLFFSVQHPGEGGNSAWPPRQKESE